MISSIKSAAVAAFVLSAVAVVSSDAADATSNTTSNSTGSDDSMASSSGKPVYGLYLAGPEVFLADPIAAGEASKAECEKANDPSLPFEIRGNYPLDAQIDGEFAYDHATGYKIFHANVGLMDESVGTVANMVRFRSPSMDVGTAWEMGYTAGNGKPVFGYYDAVPFYGEAEDPKTYPEKVVEYGYADEDNDGFDKDGLEIENFKFSDNLMLLGNLEMTGYPQQPTVYESCLDAVDWISKNCMEPGSGCVTISGGESTESPSTADEIAVEMSLPSAAISVRASSALLAAAAAAAAFVL